jgi:hypothetical protein
MMKKLLILMLVLGLVSTASAVISTGPVVTAGVSWDIVNNQLVGYNATGVTNVPGYGIDYGNSDGGLGGPLTQFVYALPLIAPPVVPPGAVYPTSLVGPGNVPGALPPNSGAIGSFVQDSILSGFNWGGYDLGDGGVAGGGVALTNWFIFDLDVPKITALIGGPGAWIDIYDYGVSAVIPAGKMNLIPEPMTIALLGLGGLLLRRRKQTA